MEKIAVIGAGAWGTALAQSMAAGGKQVHLWSYEEDVAKNMAESRENKAYLPGVALHENITPTASQNEAAEGADCLLIVTPAQHVRETLARLKSHWTAEQPVVICAKGVELETGYLMSHVAAELMAEAKIACLTGPTFASEVGKGLPCAVTLAADSKELAEEISLGIATPTLRPYASDDLISAQIGGAVKNVIAIAAGILIGKGLGESGRAALITRGLAEMSRLTRAIGGRKETLMGMCGIGDLLLTCSSMQSRNYSLGAELGKGKTLEEILGSRNAVTEGVHTARALTIMAERHAVDMPISKAVHACLSEGSEIDEMIGSLFTRPLKAEDN